MMMRSVFAVVLVVIRLMAQAMPSDSVFMVMYVDSAHVGEAAIDVDLGTYHNFNNSITVGYTLTSHGLPFEIYNVELSLGSDRQGKIKRTIEPFSYKVQNSGNPRDVVEIRVLNVFPLDTIGYTDDELRIYTDKGPIKLYLDDGKRMRMALAQQESAFATEKTQLQTSNSHLWLWLALTILAAAAVIGSLLALMRRRARRNDLEINRLTMLLSENAVHNEQLHDKVAQLYESRFATLNMLCSEYFEKGQSAQLRLTIFNEVEKEIMKLKEPKTVAHLEDAVNLYLDNIMNKVRDQLPTLSERDRLLLVYLYSGLSARAICVLTDIQIKNFYVRRQRLKERILASGVQDAAWFVGHM